MKTVHCNVCDRDVPAVNGGYKVTGYVKRDGWWVNVYVCKECGNARSVSLELAAQPEMVAVAAADDAMARGAVVLSTGMARLL